MLGTFTLDGLLIALAHFVQTNALTLSWLSSVSMSAMFVFICVDITYFFMPALQRKSSITYYVFFSRIFLLVFDPKKTWLY